MRKDKKKNQAERIQAKKPPLGSFELTFYLPAL